MKSRIGSESRQFRRATRAELRKKVPKNVSEPQQRAGLTEAVSAEGGDDKPVYEERDPPVRAEIYNLYKSAAGRAVNIPSAFITNNELKIPQPLSVLLFLCFIATNFRILAFIF